MAKRFVVDESSGEIVKEVVLPPLRTEWNYDRDAASAASALYCDDPSLAQQQFAEDADLNTLVRRFGITGQMPEGLRAPTYGDFSGIFDFQSAMNAIVAAEEAFEQMPADVRYRFHNNPADFVAFCSNPDNRAEAEKLGLVVPPAVVVEPPPQRVQIVAGGAIEGGVATPLQAKEL